MLSSGGGDAEAAAGPDAAYVVRAYGTAACFMSANLVKIHAK